MKRRIVTFLCACCLAITLTGCGDSPKEPENAREVSDTTEKQDSSEDQKTASGQVVTGGFLLTLPEGISPRVNEEGLILSDEETGDQMLVTVREYGFEEKKKEPEYFSEKAVEAGYEITREVEVLTVEKREFAYFNYLNEQDSMLLAYTPADDSRTFGVLVQRRGDRSDEEILTQIGRILMKAEETELPDTTMDDLVEQKVGN